MGSRFCDLHKINAYLYNLLSFKKKNRLTF